MSDILYKFNDYVLMGIAIVCFISGSVLILDDFRKRLYKLIANYRRIKSKVMNIYQRLFDHQSLHIQGLFIDRLKEDVWKMLIRNPYKMTVYAFVFIVLFLYKRNESMFSQTFMTYFTIILVISIIDILTRYSIFIVTKGVFDNFILNACYALIYFIIFTTLFYASMLIHIGSGREMNFIVVIITLIIILVPLNKFAAECINVQKEKFNLAIIILILLVFEVIVYLLFGTYNISLDNRYLSINTSNIWHGTLQIIIAGTENIFNYPANTARIEYIIQYLIGFFIHVIMFGFYISIVSSKVVKISRIKVKSRFQRN